MRCYGDGALAGILSVDVSSCFAPDGDGVRLVDCTSRGEILRRTLRQILASLEPSLAHRLERSVFAMHLDAEVRVGPHGVTNAGRLLVHPPGSRRERPGATLEINNLFLAADFVRTSMDLASMEGANEAGRCAAQGALAFLGDARRPVELFSYPALDRFARLQALDRELHRQGLPHALDLAPRLGRATQDWLGGWLGALAPRFEPQIGRSLEAWLAAAGLDAGARKVAEVPVAK